MRNLKEERDTRSQRSLYGEESRVGKGVNKGAAGKDSKQQKQQHQQPHKKGQSQPQQPQEQQMKPDKQPTVNGNANGGHPAADIDAAVAQSMVENLVL